MRDITADFGSAFYPHKALLVYRSQSGHDSPYVEAYDIGPDGSPINARPLSTYEGSQLAASLTTAESTGSIRKPKGVLPANILQLEGGARPHVVWYSRPKKVQLFFKENLGIASGSASVPALLWKATEDKLRIFALATGSRPRIDTPLYHAPFFNISDEGSVCMGTVKIEAKKAGSLDGFMAAWEHYFFSSYFSHLNRGRSPVKQNIVALWNLLIATGGKFPVSELIRTGLTVKNLIQ